MAHEGMRDATDMVSRDISDEMKQNTERQLTAAPGAYSQLQDKSESLNAKRQQATLTKSTARAHPMSGMVARKVVLWLSTVWNCVGLASLSLALVCAFTT